TSGEKRVFLVILFTSFSGSLVSRIPGAVHYEQRRERQKQGIEKARKDGKYKGRKPNQARHDAIIRLIESGSSWTQVQKVLGCSRGTISNALKRKTGQKSSK
ncbi:helix-turn-helix domain-containing protein, partial [Escherichia coli]